MDTDLLRGPQIAQMCWRRLPGSVREDGRLSFCTVGVILNEMKNLSGRLRVPGLAADLARSCPLPVRYPGDECGGEWRLCLCRVSVMRHMLRR